jgi:hypothetical protein
MALNGSPMPCDSVISSKWMIQEQKFDGQLNLNHPKINSRGVFMPYALSLFSIIEIFKKFYRFNQKGFGDEEPTLQRRLEEFFNRFGVVSAVRMRRDENKKFKVCHFVYIRQSITT